MFTISNKSAFKSWKKIEKIKKIKKIKKINYSQIEYISAHMLEEPGEYTIIFK